MKIYKIKIDDEELGMDAISLVEFPAVEVDFLAFSKEQEHRMDFTKFNDKKKEITGVVCLADTPILRKNDTYGIHCILFEHHSLSSYIRHPMSNRS